MTTIEKTNQEIQKHLKELQAKCNKWTKANKNTYYQDLEYVLEQVKEANEFLKTI